MKEKTVQNIKEMILIPVMVVLLITMLGFLVLGSLLQGNVILSFILFFVPIGFIFNSIAKQTEGIGNQCAPKNENEN